MSDEWIDIPLPTHTGPGAANVRVRVDSPEAVAWLARQPKPRAPRGPGTELKKLLASYGITDSPTCPCNARAAEMDRNGVAWCRNNRDTIIGWLQEGAAAWGWLAALAAKAMPLGWFVDEAIKRAEANAPLVVNQGAGGLGDAMMGACAMMGLRKLHASRPITYKIRPDNIPFLRLFNLDVDFAGHDWDNGNERPAGDPNPGDLQMNTGYGHELETKGKFTRLQRNCRNIGGVVPEIPELIDRDGLKAAQADYAGVIVLSPFSTWATREYPIRSWVTLERLLREQGYRVVVLDAPDARFPDRHKVMKSEVVLGERAEKVTGIILNAACVISNDSGLAHLGGILGVPTLVLCGQTTGPEIYGFYGRNMHYLDGHLDCKGCWWQAPFNASCQPTCPNVATITPTEIVETVTKIAGPPIGARYGETCKAHARRLSEGWYEKYVVAPCLDVGCWVDYLRPGFPCTRWDQMYGDGDATTLNGVPANSYATVYASHVLEHLHNPLPAIQRWYDVLRPGGHLVICVPHRELYEGKLDLPSRWNGDHKTFWLPDAPAPTDPPHTRGLRQVLQSAGLIDRVVSFRVLDAGHFWPEQPEPHESNPTPSMHPHGEYSIEAIVRKPT